MYINTYLPCSPYDVRKCEDDRYQHIGSHGQTDQISASPALEESHVMATRYQDPTTTSKPAVASNFLGKAFTEHPDLGRRQSCTWILMIMTPGPRPTATIAPPPAILEGKATCRNVFQSPWYNCIYIQIVSRHLISLQTIHTRSRL